MKDWQDAIEVIRKDVHEIQRDVKSLLAFKWQVMGIVLGVSFLVSTVISFAAVYVKTTF